MTRIEMQPLPRSAAKDVDVRPPSKDDLDESKDGTLALWSWATAGLLSLAAAALTLFPRALLFFSETSSTRNTLTPLERFLSVHFGIWLGATCLVLVFNIPSSSPVPPPQWQRQTHPLLGPLAGASALTAILSFNEKDVGSLASITMVGSAIISLWALWAAVFGGPGAKSKRTGADNRTSAFIFGNRSAASVQKKKWKEEQKGK